MKTYLTLYSILIAGVIGVQAQTVTFTSLMSFNQTNGANPVAGLVQGADGNFYGASEAGGAYGDGTIFQISPSGIFTNLNSFDGTNGANPRASLLADTNGNFYGTAYSGGTNNVGIIFQANSTGALTTLFTFSFESGSYPTAGLIQDQVGNFYGTTAVGGTNSNPGGTVFQLTSNRTFVSLASFDLSGIGGNSPYAGLVQGSNGNFYGTTYFGGSNGYGTIYQIDTNGTLTTLVNFDGVHGANPHAGLVLGPDDYFYGTTEHGGTNHAASGGDGTVFKVDADGNLRTLVCFNNTNGAAPQAELLLGHDGNFYGTTSAGGNLDNQPQGQGTVFEMKTNGTLIPLILFNGTNGSSPLGKLVQDAPGNFYGTTAFGGTNGFGTIFRFSTTEPPLRFLSITAGDTTTLTWSATVGKTYQMLYKTNLDQTAWSNLSTPLTATNPVMTTFDTATGPQRFYQILMQP
jgi:uncharacterized repeat protein (TIGR03803 family)